MVSPIFDLLRTTLSYKSFQAREILNVLNKWIDERVFCELCLAHPYQKHTMFCQLIIRCINNTFGENGNEICCNYYTMYTIVFVSNGMNCVCVFTVNLITWGGSIDIFTYWFCHVELTNWHSEAEWQSNSLHNSGTMYVNVFCMICWSYLLIWWARATLLRIYVVWPSLPKDNLSPKLAVSTSLILLKTLPNIRL